MNKFLGFSLGCVVLVLLSACGSAQVNEAQKLQTSTEAPVASSMPKPYSKPSASNSSKQGATDAQYNSKLAEDSVQNFLRAYFNYETSKDRVEQVKKYCTSEVQKQLGLEKTDSTVRLQSKLMGSALFQNSNGQFLAVVHLSLNGNQVTPQIMELSVSFTQGKYLVNSVRFPLMN